MQNLFFFLPVPDTPCGSPEVLLYFCLKLFPYLFLYFFLYFFPYFFLYFFLHPSPHFPAVHPNVL
ncbi:MAG: hypothetical protein EGQ98_01260 [Clostridium sp.]|nr:hypothetical protein [Clostridium sp.]